MSKSHDRRHLLAFRGIVIASDSYRCQPGERVKYITVLETLPEFAIIRSSVSEDEYQRQKNCPKKTTLWFIPGKPPQQFDDSLIGKYICTILVHDHNYNLFTCILIGKFTLALFACTFPFIFMHHHFTFLVIGQPLELIGNLCSRLS